MRQLGRSLLLCFLAALTAEFLLGDQWLHGATPPGMQVGELLLYAAYYGSGALLIREVTRRTGHGWPTILLLGAAFGIIEEGLIDESLFNPNFAGDHLLNFGFIPGLGIAGPWSIYVISLHVIWSIGVPIAIAEAVFPSALPRRVAVEPQAQARWVGVPGLVIAAVLYLAGGTAIFFATCLGMGFVANPLQLVLSAVVAAVAIFVALRLPRRAPRARTNPLLGIIVGLLLTTGYQLVERYVHVNPWIAAGAEAVVLAGGFILIARLRTLNVFGLAIGALLTYDWLGVVKAVPLGVYPTIEQATLVVLVFVPVVIGLSRRRRSTALTSGPRLSA